MLKINYPSLNLNVNSCFERKMKREKKIILVKLFYLKLNNSY